MRIRNNVTRMLDAKEIPYRAYKLPNEKLGAREAAEYLGVPLELMYKTIVASCPGGGKPILALTPASVEVEQKALARAIGVKKVKVTTLREAENLTGLQTGGISPLALLHKGFQVVLDSSVTKHDQIYISGGQRGLNIRLSPDDLITLCGAVVQPISH